MTGAATAPLARGMSKVPAVTLGFWVIKILATTLGETGGDTVSMTMDLGYLIGTAIFLSIFVVLATWQISAKRFHPFLYWATIIASTTAGTTMADFATRSLGIGYTGGSLLLLALVLATLGAGGTYHVAGPFSLLFSGGPVFEHRGETGAQAYVALGLSF